MLKIVAYGKGREHAIIEIFKFDSDSPAVKDDREAEVCTSQGGNHTVCHRDPIQESAPAPLDWVRRSENTAPHGYQPSSTGGHDSACRLLSTVEGSGSMNERLRKLWGTLKAGKTRLILLAVLLMLGLLLWGRLLLKQVPQSAIAEPRQAVPASSFGNHRLEPAERKVLDIELPTAVKHDNLALDSVYYDEIGPID